MRVARITDFEGHPAIHGIIDGMDTCCLSTVLVVFVAMKFYTGLLLASITNQALQFDIGLRSRVDNPVVAEFISYSV